jgi:hypothetical protein
MRLAALLIALGSALAHADPPPAAAPPVAATKRAPPATGYVDLALRWARGRITVEKVERGAFDHPTDVRRYMGRFEARVSRRGRAVDNVRFDFPLLGDADAGVQGALNDKMKENLVTVTRVRVPLVDGADTVTLADTRGGREVRVALPAVTAAAAIPDGGAGD